VRSEERSDVATSLAFIPESINLGMQARMVDLIELIQFNG